MAQETQLEVDNSADFDLLWRVRKYFLCLFKTKLCISIEIYIYIYLGAKECRKIKMVLFVYFIFVFLVCWESNRKT